MIEELIYVLRNPKLHLECSLYALFRYKEHEDKEHKGRLVEAYTKMAEAIIKCREMEERMKPKSIDEVVKDEGLFCRIFDKFNF